MDETSWSTKGERTFAWVMAPTKSEEAVFVVGKTRGKGVAEELFGENWNGVRITDCYGAYKNLQGDHQACWPHIIRKARDLAQNQSLEENKRKFSEVIYRDLQEIYHNLKAVIQNGKSNQKLIPRFKQKVKKEIKAILRFKEAPRKLTDLARLMDKYLDELFTCLKYDNVPADNNKAEQKLRHLVLKRKNSFGTKTEKGNETFSINASVLLSMWWNNRTNFWPRFNELMA
jgi:transposase